jgi:hypothetical protein
MRYNKYEFDKAVNYYKKGLKKTKAKSIFVYGKISKDAFFSLAPLSKAADMLDIDLNVSLGYKSKSYDVLFKVWDIYKELKEKKINSNTKALGNLIKEIKIKNFEKYFEAPDIIVKVTNKCFEGGLKYKTKWFTLFMASKLKQTTNSIIKNVYNLKKSESFGMGFVLVPKKLSHPLQDYLDSYAISYSVFLSSKFCKSITLKASTLRESMRDNPEKISELMTTLIGFELEKDINLPVFKIYKIFAKIAKLNINIPQATFFISSKGYHGKHLFGEKTGYPTLNQKTKWNSPGGIIYKFQWYPQSELEERAPKSRVAFTSTVPIDRLIESTLIDYKLMRSQNSEIIKTLEKCDKVVVKSNVKNGCNFEVGLLKRDGSKRLILGSDSDVRTILHPLWLKKNKKMGRMANIPGGEAFTTPSYVKGRIVGDVVINIDKSHTLNSKNPFVATSTKKGYKIISGPKKVIDAFNKRKKDAWKNILEQEKNKSLSADIIKLKKENFNKIGEFAINTNPNARLCDYLIINEKIANMIHVAFGSGFEPDTATEYHMDVVINSPKQQLDIYGIYNKNKKRWIIKKGHFGI